MAKWINRSLVQAGRNGTTSHTISFTPAMAGNLLVMVMEGAVTHTVPTGWTLRNQALNNTELSVYTKTATDGESSFSTTHNGSDYPVVAAVYEFASGTTWVGGVSATGVHSQTGENPGLTGLTGTNLLFAVVGAASSEWVPAGVTATWSGTPTPTEDIDLQVPVLGTDGYLFSLCYVEDSTATSFAALGSLSEGPTNKEALTFAVNVPAGGDVTGTATLSGSGAVVASGEPQPSSAVALGASGALTTTAAPAMVGASAVSASGTLTAVGSPRVVRAGSIGASGTLSASGSPRHTGSAALAATGGLTSSGAPSLTATAGLSGTGTLTTEGAPSVVDAAALSGEGTLTSAVGGHAATAALGGTGTLGVAGVASIAGVAALSALGALTAQGAPSPLGVATLDSVGTFVVIGTPHITAVAVLSASGSLAGNPTPLRADITVTAALEPRRWGASLTARTKTATLEPRRWKGTIE